ncbi:bestrophin family ion channel [Achromobacter xylosoxidans]|jgi:putative membrane protein|uniref:bestrophin family protein n=1 Tax=Achromobacter TaxID=222 RepID=UPI0001F42630|nr:MULTISPECIES: bestrophin family ion channel [Achromobacter]AHC44532.1 putative membrane protein [Achromobacter xylosoxidans NBRC 15126 = ATCC 27061]AMH05591.1 bestrophin [Achromobacter xylosoxidans]AXA75040.1 bestrophin [Achromobacter xylosoxidans]EFV82337.1 membrane protein [Achromobacter xylosoxidans C54]KOQ20876.1 bestrophin [Achromobacter xylosoxidans]
MIVRPRPSALGLFFVLRGSIIPRIFSRILVITLLSCVVVWMYHRQWFSPTHLSAVPFSLFGLALSVFMGFRNNVCYDRWWEARKQWGDLIVQARSLARESAVLLAASTANPVQERLVRRCIGFGYALAARLRDQDVLAAVRPWVQPEELDTLAGNRNVPDALLLAVNRDLAACLRRGELTDILYQALTQRVAQCAAIQAACERIKYTPTPFAYSLLLHRTAWLFCLLLPFGLVGTLEYLMPVAVTIIAYTFFGLDALGDELEDPFGLEENDLPLSALARVIEIDLLDGLGVRPLPEAPQPVDFVLR